MEIYTNEDMRLQMNIKKQYHLFLKKAIQKFLLIVSSTLGLFDFSGVGKNVFGFPFGYGGG